MCEFLINQYHTDQPTWFDKPYGAFGDPEVQQFHRSLPGYKATPLVDLPGLAAELGIGKIMVKDEGQRFGVKAFKPLGASYSVFRFLKGEYKRRFNKELKVEDFLKADVIAAMGAYTFCAATDGNHGRAVAWTARQLKQKSVIYMPSNTVKARIENIKSEGAEVRLIDGTFDECVLQCDRDARDNGWQVIADTAYEGYMDLPNYIMAGYSTIFYEMEDLLGTKESPAVDLVLVQAGVGGLAAAACWYFKTHFLQNCPCLVCVEPMLADSFMESAKYGEPRESRQNYQSIMAGLNCGVSLVAFPILKDAADLFISISDCYAEQAMRRYFYSGSDVSIVSGESGASGLAGLLALMQDEKLTAAREFLKLGAQSRVLIINTEADTDPENFERIIKS